MSFGSNLWLFSEFDFEDYMLLVMNNNKKIMHLLILHEFKVVRNFVSWQCLTTFCWYDTAETHRLGIWDFAMFTIFYWSLTHRLPFFSSIWTLLCQKTFCSKGEVETAFKDCLASKPFVFYHTGINNLVNQWQKCIDIQESYFAWLKHNSNSLIKVDNVWNQTLF